MKPRTAILTALLCGFAPLLSAQDETKSADEIAKELANPNTPLATLNFKNQLRWFEGNLPNADGQFGSTVLFQPAFPNALKNGNMFFVRPALPLVASQPVFNETTQNFDTESGLGDLVFDVAVGKTSADGSIRALGFVGSVPTATERALGTRRWSIGPELLVGKLTKTTVLGIFPNHMWDFAGSGAGSVNTTTAQFFGIYLPGGGWNVGSVPIITYEWEKDQWTIPLNLQVGKTVKWGKQPWKLSLEVNYYVEKNDAIGPEWMVGINISPVVKNPFQKFFD